MRWGRVNCDQALGWEEVLVLVWGTFGVLQLAKVTVFFLTLSFHSVC